MRNIQKWLRLQKQLIQIFDAHNFINIGAAYFLKVFPELKGTKKLETKQKKSYTLNNRGRGGQKLCRNQSKRFQFFSEKSIGWGGAKCVQGCLGK